MPRQQAVRLERKHAVAVVGNIQILAVAAQGRRAVHRLVSDLDGNAGLEPREGGRDTLFIYEDEPCSPSVLNSDPGGPLACMFSKSEC